MDVLKPRTFETFTQLLADNRIVVLDFYADWCGPCKNASPHFAVLARELPQAKFIAIDVEQSELSDVVEHFSVTSLPAFVVVVDNQTVLRLNGYDSNTMSRLRQAVLQQ